MTPKDVQLECTHLIILDQNLKEKLISLTMQGQVFLLKKFRYSSKKIYFDERITHPM